MKKNRHLYRTSRCIEYTVHFENALTGEPVPSHDVQMQQKAGLYSFRGTHQAFVAHLDNLNTEYGCNYATAHP